MDWSCYTWLQMVIIIIIIIITFENEMNQRIHRKGITETMSKDPDESFG